MSNKIDFTTFNKVPGIGTLIRNLDTSTDNTTYTPTQDGYLCGICRVNSNGVEGYSFINIDNIQCGGIVHAPYSNSHLSTAIMLPVKAGQTIEIRLNNGQFQGNFYSVTY